MSGPLLVTGGDGFLGRHLLVHFLAEGTAVTAFVQPGRGAGLPARVGELAAFLGREVDLRALEVVEGRFEDRDLVSRLVGSHPWILHAAGTVHGTDPEAFEAGNPGLLRALLDAEGWHGGHRLLHVSSVAAQGPSPGPEPLPATAPARPPTLYGRAKRRCEVLLEQARVPGRHLAVRPPALLGPADYQYRPSLRWAERGLYPVVARRGQRLQFLDVRDLARALEELLRRLDRGDPLPPVLNVVPPAVHTHEDLRAALEAACGRRLLWIRIPLTLLWLVLPLSLLLGWLRGRPPLFTADRIRAGMPRYWVHDGAAFQELVPGFAWTSLEDSLRGAWAWEHRSAAPAPGGPE